MRGKPTRRDALMTIACASIATMSAGHSRAQNAYPTKPVRLIVGLAPGGLADITARLIAPGLGSLLGQPIIVENQVGAGGVTAAQTVARAAPDGYTLMLALDATVTITPALRTVQTPFDPVKDFTTIGRVLQAPLVVFANKDFEGETIADLVRLAKAGGGKQYFYGSAGVGSSGHLLGEYLKQVAGIDIAHVPYRGASEALQDTVSGKIAMMMSTAPAGMEFVKAGQMKALGVSGKSRTPELPTVPTIAESGVASLQDFDVQAWAGVMAPAGLPEPIVLQINAALQKVMNDPTLADRFRTLGVTVGVTSPQSLREQIATEVERWKKVGQDAHIQLQ